MDLQNEANYKFYKCRSLLACDSGGMVYDRSKSFDSKSYGEMSIQYTSPSQREAGPLEKIIYIIDAKNQSKTKNKSLVDLTTHLDDDEFNDYEMNTSVIGEAVNQAQSVNEINYSETESNYFEFQAVQNDVDENVSNLFDEILGHEDNVAIQRSRSSRLLEQEDSVIIHHSQSSQILEHEDNIIIHHSDSSQNSNHTNNLSYETTSDTISIYNSSAKDTLKAQANLAYEFDPYKTEEVESYKNHMNKRKQIYNVKEDGYSELLDCSKSIQQNLVPSIKSKKKKSAYNKENQRKKLLSQKRNPFANVKMSSILKGKRNVKKTKSFLVDQALEPTTTSCEECSAINSSCFYDDEVLISKKNSCQYADVYFSNSKDDSLQEQGSVTQINSDLSNANYLDYLQPSEQIVESDMDKLLTPTIENELSGVVKVDESISEIKRKVDCNGNEVDFQDIQKMKTLKSVLSPSEIVERKLCLDSIYAKQIGMKNLFNTSNDAVINEIIFGAPVVHEKINLEFNYIRNVEETYLKRNLVENPFLKSVSCTLVESLNELHRFGGFVDDNSQDRKSSEEINANAMSISNGFVNISETSNFQNNKAHIQLNEKDSKQINSNFTFNFSNKSNLLNLDFQSRCHALEYLPNAKHEVKRSSGPLIIKMKRINDGNNEYVIDDSIKKSRKVIKKKTTGSVQNIARYTCHDCAKKFRTKKILIRHVSEYHRGPYGSECEICGVKNKKSSGHKKHEVWCPKSVVHKCNSCDRTYCYRASLLKHLKTHQR